MKFKQFLQELEGDAADPIRDIRDILLTLDQEDLNDFGIQLYSEILDNDDELDDDDDCEDESVDDPELSSGSLRLLEEVDR